MNASPDSAGELVPSGQNLPASLSHELPGIVARAGTAAVFAADEFFFGRIRNEHTRKAYFIAVKRFLTAMRVF
jgi:integrase/recombinase XerD